MRAFLTAFICLSTLAMAQNVVVATPVVSDGIEAHDSAGTLPPLAGTPGSELTISAGPEEAPRSFVGSSASRGPSASRATTMLLFVFGLSGLCAVGGRRHDRKQRQLV